MQGEITVSIWRGDSSGGAMAEYRVPRRANQTVLDVVTWVQRNAAADLSYRFACRVGMCGSCAMTVNGAPRWTCRTHVQSVLRDDALRIAPLRNFPVVKDLVCDMSEFFGKWQRAEGRFYPSATPPAKPPSPPAAAIKSTTQSNAEKQCIHCGVCYAACDSVAWNDAYLGPAALNRAFALQNDSRDAAHAKRLRAVTGDGGCQHCHSQQNCAQYCPVQLNPARAIAGLKRAVILER